MIAAINYSFILIFQFFIFYLYFENVLARKKKTLSYYILFATTWAVSLGITFLWLPILNLVIFLASTFLIACFGYGAKIRSSVFHTFMLAIFMLGTEFLIVYFSTAALDMDLHAHRYDDTTFMVQSALSKLLFFIAAYFAAKIRKKQERELESIPVLLALSFIPFSSITFLLLMYQAIYGQAGEPVTPWLSAGTIVLLISNMIAFFIYELTRRTHIKFTRLQLEQQREKISTEYYELLSEKQESQKILIHDFNRHLQAIQHIETASPEVKSYAASLSDEFGLSDVITYSGNKYVDVIINRYVQVCKASGTELETDVQSVSLDFMSDVDITALLDNLLENAVEAASRTDIKRVILSVYEHNKNYVIIKTQNSCAQAPRIHNGRILSSKRDGKASGIGLKSIHRVAAKYNGDVEWQYFENTSIFEMAVVLGR